MIEIGILLVGIVLGATAVWLALRTKITSSSYDKSEYEKDKLEAEADKATLMARADGLEKQLNELKSFVREKDREIASLNELKRELIAGSRSVDKKVDLSNDAEQRLAAVFKALSAKALQSSNQSLLELVKTQLETFQKSAEADLQARQTAIANLVDPLKISLDRLGSAIQKIESSQDTTYENLTQHLQLLSESQNKLQLETASLVKALRTLKDLGTTTAVDIKSVEPMPQDEPMPQNQDNEKYWFATSRKKPGGGRKK
jgi:DNA recombination protein RmuC